MNVTIERFAIGPLETNAYLVHGENEQALVVDPSSGCDQILAYCRDHKLKVAAILLTHAHFDHAMGIPEIQKAFPETTVWVHASERVLLERADYNGSYMIGQDFSYEGPVSELSEGPAVIGGFELEVRHVPGHSPGGCAFLFEGHCLVGDAVFAGSIGRADLPGGDGPLLIKSIKEKLLTLPDETVLYPGHGGRTTVSREKRMNPFLR